MKHHSRKRYVEVLDDLLPVITTHHTVGCRMKLEIVMMCRDSGFRSLKRETPKTVQPTLKVGDHVRMVGPRRLFASGYHEKWTREVFVLTQVDTDAVPVTYRVKDLMYEDISRRFYAEELPLIYFFFCLLHVNMSVKQITKKWLE